MTFKTLSLHVVVGMALLTACGGPLKYEVKGSQLSPGSDARVHAEVDAARHVTEVEVEAKNLTPAERLVDGGNTYVIWARKSADAPWSRVGALALEDDGREGKAKLTVPETAFDLEISAESSPSVASPSGKIVFEQAVGK
jgi:hypothetical protein